MLHVVAVIGRSPGGLTQLLWYLAAREQRRVAGVDIWVLPDHLGMVGFGGLFSDAGWYFDQLVAALGPAAARLPAWSLVPRVNPPPEHPPGTGFAVFAPPQRRFRAELAARVRFLRSQGAALFGGLCGAEPPEVTALYRSFELGARQSDPLGWVTIDPRIAVGTDIDTFVCPRGPIALVPPEEQVQLVSVPFHADSDLVARDPHRHADGFLALRRAHEAPPAPGPLEVAVRHGGRYTHLALGNGEIRMGAETWTLYRALSDAAPCPVRRQDLARLGRRGREPASVDRMLNTLCSRMELEVAHDPRWIPLVPRRDAAGRWGLAQPIDRPRASVGG
jgi:hypothetical protein